MTTGRADKPHVTGDKQAACLRSGNTGRYHSLSGAGSRDRLREVSNLLCIKKDICRQTSAKKDT